MAQSVARLVKRVGVDLATALRMAVTVPATLTGRPHLALMTGRNAADLLVRGAQLTVVGTCAGSGQQP